MMDIKNLNSLLSSSAKIFTVTRNLGEFSKKFPENSKYSMYKRQDKSLFELSKRFVDHLWELTDYVVNLETLTETLDIERRRLYDIINILESLGVIYRVSKSCFMWKGLQEARTNIDKFGKYFQNNNTSSEEERAEVIQNFIKKEYRHFNPKKNLKREKSLAILSLNLVQYFYENNFVQTLEDTAQKFTDTEGTKLKTKIRRLYDITNVFKSLGLIKKISSKSRKIAIQWRGIEGFDEFMVNKSKARAASSKNCNNGSAFSVVSHPISPALLGKRACCEDPEKSMILNFMKLVGGVQDENRNPNIDYGPNLEKKLLAEVNKKGGLLAIPCVSEKILKFSNN